MYTNLTNLYNYMREITWVGTEKSLNVLRFQRTIFMYVSDNGQRTLNQK